MDRLGGSQSRTPRMRAVFETLRAIAPRHGGVLLRGELGTGRQTLARALHELERPGQPFIVVDIPSIPPTMLDSVLFGHEYSTFTGGAVVKRGSFETAESGTVFLREVGALPFPNELPLKLLRVFERREFRRLGSNMMRPFRGRVVSATHCNLAELVATTSLHQPLVTALAEDADVVVPPLRERVGDLPALLAEHQLDSSLLARLSKLQWRGNFGALEGFVHALSRGTAPAEVVTELELLEAIEDAPDDDAPRLVYADLLARRGDPRGELINVQCRLAQAPADRRIRAVERQLLEAHHKAWASQVIEVASTPAAPAEVSFARGFVEGVSLESEAMRRFDVLVRAAPLLTKVTLRGSIGTDTWISPLLVRLRTLEATIDKLGTPSVVTLGQCPYLTGLRVLALSSSQPAAIADDPELRQLAVETLATSEHLAGLTSLALQSYELAADNLATMLGDQVRWQLSALALIGAELGPAELTILADAPGAMRLRALDLRGSAIREASARVLAGAASLANLTTLRMNRIDDDAREILLASPVLRNVTLLDGSQQMIRSSG